MTLDLDKLENLHQSTTPGPWKDGFERPSLSAGALDRNPGWHAIIVPLSPFVFGAVGALTQDKKDAAWIVAAHEAFPAILGQLRLIQAMTERQVALERENDQLREQMDDEMRVQQEKDEL